MIATITIKSRIAPHREQWNSEGRKALLIWDARDSLGMLHIFFGHSFFSSYSRSNKRFPRRKRESVQFPGLVTARLDWMIISSKNRSLFFASQIYWLPKCTEGTHSFEVSLEDKVGNLGKLTHCMQIYVYTCFTSRVGNCSEAEMEHEVKELKRLNVGLEDRGNKGLLLLCLPKFVLCWYRRKVASYCCISGENSVIHHPKRKNSTTTPRL